MESRLTPQDNTKGRIAKKLDKLAEDIKKLPKHRLKSLKEHMEKDSYSLTEFAKKLGVHYQTIQRAVLSGKLKSFKIGGKTIRIPRKELDKYVDGKRAYSVAEVAKKFGVIPVTIRRHIAKGQIKAFRLTDEGQWFIDEAELQRIMNVED